MSQPLQTQNEPGAVVIDANILIAICSKEPTETTAREALADYATRNWAFYAPSCILSEALFVLCKKLQAGIIDAASQRKGVEDFHSYLSAILPPPKGDASLVLRTEDIRQGYSCLHSADGFYCQSESPSLIVLSCRKSQPPRPDSKKLSPVNPGRFS